MKLAAPMVDVLAAVALAAFMASVSLVDRVTQPDTRPVTPLALALLVVGGLALAVRRNHPVPAYLVAVGAATAYLWLRFAGWPVYIGAGAGLVALVVGVAATRVWVPLAAAGGVAIAVATGRPEDWNAASMVAVAVVWTVAAVLVARAAALRRRQAEQEAARRAAEERLRVARELHDVLSHSLATISLRAGVGLHLIDRQPEEAREALRAIREVSNDALAQSRAALAAVRSGPGLSELPALVDSVRASGVTVDLHVDESVPEPAGTDAYRIVQEALTNVMRHAGPEATASVRIERTEGWLQIDVTDDGVGTTATAGHGLRGMAERARTLGGELRAGPGPDGGFAVHARLPLEDR
ncbi:sensor histidine kinase [Kutzneria buriramensis]|uniref:histidine kinase n=1 Tax=Kutzneria buriramensis TaxID=1045776 RepID=A0A3E0GTV0_9PSEU|nr:sensor histidine kinase [Kutzneria buriramensis]REH27672.1 histidine kinase [Kutzneria buriramensis]